MGEGKSVYEGLVNKFTYIQEEKLFFKAAFKNDDQNCLRDHDFQLITAFYTDQIESRTGKKDFSASAVSIGNVLSGFYLYDRSVGTWLPEMHTGRTGQITGWRYAGRTE